MRASLSIAFSVHKIQHTLKLTKWFLDLEDGVSLEKKDDVSKLVKEALLSTLANHLLENQNAECVSIWILNPNQEKLTVDPIRSSILE
jgi:hypothetical protein